MVVKLIVPAADTFRIGTAIRTIDMTVMAENNFGKDLVMFVLLKQKTL